MKLLPLVARVLPLFLLLLSLPACDTATNTETGSNVPTLNASRTPETIARAILADEEFNTLVREITRNARTGNREHDMATFGSALKSDRITTAMRRIFARHGKTVSNGGAVQLALRQIAEEASLSKMDDCEAAYHNHTSAVTAVYFSQINGCDYESNPQQCRDELEAWATNQYATAVDNYFACMAPPVNS